MQESRNIAQRVGRWSAKHRKTAIIGWITFVVLAFMVGGAVGTEKLTQQESGVGESGQASKLVSGAFPEKHDEVVLIQSKDHKYDSREFHAVVADVEKRLEATKGVEEVRGPYDDEAAAISGDGHSALISFEIPGDALDAATKATVDETVAATTAVQKAHGDFVVDQMGSGSSEEAFMAVFEKDLKKATFGSLPITLILLVIAFGTLVAAGIPLLLAITGIVATMGLVGPLSQISPVENSIMHVILLIGLAVGVDYALFYLRRVREERAAGRDKEAGKSVV